MQRLDLPDGVIREDYVDEARLWSLMAACDVHVSLRSPTMGETSGSVIRALSLGKPVVVSDLGWFSELPDEAVLKVPVDEREADTLAAALELLASEPGVRARIADAARQLAVAEHDLARVADLYTAAREEAAGGPAVHEVVLREVADAAAEVGIGEGAPEARTLAERLREVGLGR
jgi:glycosyltransferase involved in cell wall biosynthesis